MAIATQHPETARHPERPAVNLTIIRKTSRHLTPHRRHHEDAGHEGSGSHEDSNHRQEGGNHAVVKPRAYTLRIPASPLTFYFSSRRWKSGVKFLLGSVAAIATGSFVASQIVPTPSLRVQGAIVSLVCIIGGLFMLHFALRDLFGRLRIDAHGVRLSPAYLGFSIPWTDLRAWDVDGLAFRFATANSEYIYAADHDLFSSADSVALSRLLSSCVPEKKKHLDHCGCK